MIIFAPKLTLRKMKKLPLIINTVLLAAVAVLYYLHFSQKGSSVSSADRSDIVLDPGSIAFVNIDTLQAHLDMFYDFQQDLTEKQKISEKKYENSVKEWQRNVADYQDKVQKGLVTRSKAAEIEKQLQTDEQKLMALRDNLAYELQEESTVLNRQIMNEIIKFLDDYNKNKNYRFIIQNSYGGVLLVANDSSNITQDVIKGLNEKYNKTKEKSK